MIDMNYYAILREVHSFAGVNDVSVEFVRVENPNEFVPHAKMDMRTGRRTIVLLQPEATWTADEMLMWRGCFYHEIGHFHPDVMDDYDLLHVHGLKADSFYAHGLNGFSDYRQEKNELGVYEGRDSTLSQTQAMGIRKILDRHGKDLGKITDINSNGAIMSAVLHLTTTGREDWQPDVGGLADALKSKMTPELQGRIQEMYDKGFKEKLNACKSAEDQYQLWRELLELFERNADEEEQQAQAGAAGEGGEGSADEGTGGKGAEGKSSGAGSKRGSGGSRPRDEAGKLSWKDLTVNEHDTEETPTYTPVSIDYRGYRGDKESFKLADKLDIRDYVNKTGSISRSTTSYDSETRNYNAHTGLSNKIRKLLQVKAQSLTVHGKKKGKLSSKSIYRAAIKGTGGNREKVFKQTIHQYDLDTAVTVLVDFSGSMGGSKMRHAIASGLMLNEAISKIGVPLEILGFTERHSASVMNVFKTFTKPIDNEKLRQNMCRATNCMANNADGEAIMYAYTRLRRQPNKRKLLLVLSDGSPASDRGSCHSFTKNVIKQIERDRIVEIYGLGIEDRNVEGLYTNHSTIRHSDELEGAVLSVIKNHILK